MVTTLKQANEVYQNQRNLFITNKFENTALIMDDELVVWTWFWVPLTSGAGAVNNGNEALRFRTQSLSAWTSSPWHACAILWQLLFLVRLGSMAIDYEECVRLTALSDWTNTYVYRTIGGDVIATPWDYSEWVYFEYDQTVSPNWRICTSDWWVRTKADSWVPVTTTYTKLWVMVNSAWTSATFTINGVVVGTITTNIPIWSGKEFWFMHKIERTAWTSQRQAIKDWVKCLITYNNWR